ncbi:MAG: CRISPR system precrRNA processing endoribonuclease RAMP protein Cas6 [Candidatus Saccharicenans sp.]|nr:CRISPR system precrRNA processing endoribonuclease RAMP protein Cas6 [Candidatus Saccharicenans sp.]
MILRFQIYKFTIQFLEPCQLPAYKGSALRGGFGNALKRTICLYKGKTCSECTLRSECAYAYLFESIPAREIELAHFGKYETIPHPFIIEPPEEARKLYQQGESLEFKLILIGQAIKYLPYFLLAFERFGEIGIGQGKKRFKLDRVTAGQNEVYRSDTKEFLPGDFSELTIPEDYEYINIKETKLTLEFRTPVRIKYNRDSVTRLDFFILITNILRRLMLLNYFHGDGNPPAWDHKKLIDEAKKVSIESNCLAWHDWERYSNRQKTKMKLGGLKGVITYTGPLENFWPLLKAGEILHVGKGTSFGLGKYLMINRIK